MVRKRKPCRLVGGINVLKEYTASILSRPSEYEGNMFLQSGIPYQITWYHNTGHNFSLSALRVCSQYGNGLAVNHLTDDVVEV